MSIASFDVTARFDGHVLETVLQKDGSIVLAGPFVAFDDASQASLAHVNVARLSTNGTMDRGFAPTFAFAPKVESPLPSLPSERVQCLAVQPDDKLLVGGVFSSIDGVPRLGVARLNPDGKVDSSFDPDVPLFDPIWSLPRLGPFLVQSDGKILIVSESPQSHSGAVRLNTEGSRDRSFQPAATPNLVDSMAAQRDGRILLGGSSWNLVGEPPPRLVRLNSDASLDDSFNVGKGPDERVKRPTAAPLHDVAYGKGMFVAVGWARTILTSTNGTDWTEQTSGARLDLRGVTHGQDSFTAVGGERIYRDPPAMISPGTSTSLVITSPDGRVWNFARVMMNQGGAADIASGNGQCVGVGGFTTSGPETLGWGMQTLTTLNETALVPVTTTGLPIYQGQPILPALALQKIVFGNGLLVASSTFSAFGFSEAVAISTNGIRWQQAAVIDHPGRLAVGSLGILAPVPMRELEGGLTGLAFGRGTFLATGVGALFSSTDAFKWHRREPGTPDVLYDAAFGKDTFVVVGEAQTILQSRVFQDGSGALLRNPAVIGDRFQVSVLTQPGKEYTLEFNDDLRTDGWTALTAIQGNGSVMILSDLVRSSPRFYQVRTR